jgi:hypothetical protein
MEAEPKAETKRKRARVAKTKINKLRVLSIDVGLRNLGLALLEWNGDNSEPHTVSTLTASNIVGTTQILHAENVDVLEENGCTAKNAKTIGPLKQVSFWHACMLSRKALFLDVPPDIVVVEVQDGGNATMRQVSTGIVGLFMGHYEARHTDGHISHMPQFTMVRGDMKMKICRLILDTYKTTTNAAAPIRPISFTAELGEPAEAELREMAELGETLRETLRETLGEPAAAPALPSLPPPPPEYLKKINPKRYYAMLKAGSAPENPNKMTSGRSRQAYEARKRMSVEAFETYMAENEPAKKFFQGMTHKKRRDIADAIFQGMYIICRETKVEL